MAFCNSCGATVDAATTKFCNKCGAPVAAPVSAAPAGYAPVSAPPAPPKSGGSSALKIILIVVGVIVLLGILGIVAVGVVGYRIAKSSHVRQEGNNVKVETPFGSVESSQDPATAARNLGVEVYPGAELLKQGAASATFGGIHTATLFSETSDSVDKVAAFYKSKFPNAAVTTSDTDRCTIVSNDHKNMITINIEAHGDKTKIQITNVNKSGSSNSSSSSSD